MVVLLGLFKNDLQDEGTRARAGITIALAGTHHLFIHANFFLFSFLFYGFSTIFVVYYFSHFFYFLFSIINRYFIITMFVSSPPLSSSSSLLAIIHHCSMLFSSVRTVHAVYRNRRDCTTDEPTHSYPSSVE